MNNTLPELLAPAGSPDSLRAALAAGADAVYFGGTSFSNRMRAKNFTDGDLYDAIRLCHDAGAKAHITVNTRVRDREMDDVLALCDLLLGGASPDERADAIICADFGVAREILTRYPHAVLHASTQTSLSSPSDCRELAKLGFARLVVPRELSKTEIAALCADGREHGFEIEMFLHGAHCVSLSGQCLMSFVMGGRSGNRGECAQPCRLPFRIDSDGAEKTDTPLSLADMCLAGRIPEVIGTGVASLKLEGRLKPASYVYGVTAIYRRLLDERRAADKQELRALEDLFTRGFTDGYFAGQNAGRYASMGGKTVSETEKKGADRTSEINRKLKERLAGQADPVEERALTASFVMREGAPLSLTLVCGAVSASAEGELPQKAEGRPMDKASAAKNLVKFGGTGFVLPVENIAFDMGDGLWVPVSVLNNLRRAALAALQEELAKAPVQSDIPAESSDISENVENPSVPEGKAPARRVSDKPYGRQYRTAEFADASLLFGFTEGEAAEFLGYFRRVYVPYDKAAEAVQLAARVEAVGAVGAVGAGCEIGGVLPPLTPDDGKVRGILEGLKGSGVTRVMCHTPGQLALALEAGLPGDLSFRANITSAASLAAWRSTGLFASVQLSPELPAAAAAAIGDHLVTGALRRPAGALAYGKIPLMALSRCVLCGGRCRKGNTGGRNASAKEHFCHADLVDRKGEAFPVFGLPDCESMVCNSVPIWMGDRQSDLKSLSFLSFFFTDETPSAALRVLRAYRDGLPGTGRRL